MASQINASNSGFGGIVSTGDSSGQLQLQTAGTTAVTIDTSQNVGIGVSSIAPKLEVNGLGRFATAADKGVIGLGEGANSTQVTNVGLWRGGANSAVSTSTGIVTTGGNFLNLGGYDGMVFTTGAAAIGSQTERMRIDSSGNVFAGPTATQNGATGVIYSKTTAKAWVTFAGGTGTISSSFNVSSVTRVSTGIYTVTFTSAMPNANYSSFYMAQPTVSNAGADTFTINPTTTTVQLNHWEANVQRDSSYSCFVAFGSA